MPVNTFPTSTLSLSSLQEADTASLLDIRPRLELLGDNPELIGVLEDVQRAFDALQETLRQASPTLDYLSIDAADIEDLYVGSEYGPGSMSVGSGPPNYDEIGWIGTALAGTTPIVITSVVGGLVTTATRHGLSPGHTVLIADTDNPAHNAAWVVDTAPTLNTFTGVGLAGDSTDGTLTLLPTVITDIVAGLVTTTEKHNLKVGNAIYIEGTSNAAHNGTYCRVATAPSDTTFTITELTGNSTGGEFTVLFRGGWFETLAVAGTSFDTAKLIADVDGSLSIYDALIRLQAANSSITLDPSNGSIVVANSISGDHVDIVEGMIYLFSGANQTNLTGGRYQAYAEGLTSLALSHILDIFGYCGAGGYGPIVRLSHSNGTAVSPDPTLNGDVLGGLLASGTNGVDYSPQAAGIYAVAAEDFVLTAMGTGLFFNTTPLGTNVANTAMTLSSEGDLWVARDVHITRGPTINGVPGIDKAVTRITGITVTTSTLQYKDWAGANQSRTIVVGVTPTTETDTVTKGILTA